MEELLNIAEAAKQLNVSIDTVRRWEKKGLIKAIRSSNNHRLFKLEETQRLHGKVYGLSSNENNYRILKDDSRTAFTAIDLFAGAGGTALGFDHAGINHVLLNEINANAASTLQHNRPNWNVVQMDVADLDFTQYRDKVDIIEGGFPCQAFSYAGKKLGFEDTRGTLFYQFARAIRDVRPKVAIGENVRGLLNHEGGRTLAAMVRVLESLGYRVAYNVLRSQYFDVPQKRERLVIMALREDIKTPIYFPKEKDYIVSLREALEGVPHSDGQMYSEKKLSIMKQIPAGGYWRDLPVELQREYMGASYFMGGGKTGMARRLAWNEPSLTLTCNPAQKQTERCHPEETRPLTVREYARIQTFPDNWHFIGSVSSCYTQIGNAVPVNLGYYMAKAAIATLTGRDSLGKDLQFTEAMAIELN